MKRVLFALCAALLLGGLPQIFGCVPITQGMTVENAERTAVEVFCARMARCSEGRYDFETCIAGDYWPTPAPTMGIPNGLDRCLRFVSEQPCTEMERTGTGTREDYESWDVYVVCREEMSWDS